MRPLRLALILCLLALSAGGCASVPLLAAMDVMNVAETGKTGYDMMAGIHSRKTLERQDVDGVQVEARLRAALDAQGGSLRWAMPLVSQDRAYVVGTYASPQELERARVAVRGIKGVREVVLCLFPQGSGPPGGVSDGEMRDNILRLSGIRTREVRVQVVEGNAVLVGRVRTKAEQDQLVESAHVAGAASVRNYVRLFAANEARQ